MSKETYTRCDMCARVIPDTETNAGHFYRDAETWGGVLLDLCGECADRVQRFISRGGARVRDGLEVRD